MAGREKAIIRLKNAYGYHAIDKLSHKTLSVDELTPFVTKPYQ
jgi:hypothetical protein